MRYRSSSSPFHTHPHFSPSFVPLVYCFRNQYHVCSFFNKALSQTHICELQLTLKDFVELRVSQISHLSMNQSSRVGHLCESVIKKTLLSLKFIALLFCLWEHFMKLLLFGLCGIDWFTDGFLFFFGRMRRGTNATWCGEIWRLNNAGTWIDMSFIGRHLD